MSELNDLIDEGTKYLLGLEHSMEELLERIQCFERSQYADLIAFPETLVSQAHLRALDLLTVLSLLADQDRLAREKSDHEARVQIHRR